MTFLLISELLTPASAAHTTDGAKAALVAVVDGEDGYQVCNNGGRCPPRADLVLTSIRSRATSRSPCGFRSRSSVRMFPNRRIHHRVVSKKDWGTQMVCYQCGICGHMYDPASGEKTQKIEPGIDFEKLPGDWTCPICMAGKGQFRKCP
jgi:rubredoxin